MSELSILLVDIGNTSIKYCFLEQASADPESAESITGLFKFISQNMTVKQIYLANVGDQQWSADLFQFCLQRGIQCHIVSTEKSRFGITNCYQYPSRMGVDRWLAIVAAAALTQQDYAVIDVGTAITCDFVIDKQHVGGWIAPGFSTMRNAIVANTQLVFADQTYPTVLNGGTDTEMCVGQGCHAAVLGFALAAKALMSEKSSGFDIIIGGGGKKMLTSVELGASILVANLVVQGLARYASLDVTSVISK